jgi:hypothetical protein
MKTYKELMSEGKYSGLIKGSMVMFSTRLNDLEKQLRQESNGVKKINLLSQQIKLLGYMVGIGIGFSTGDRSIIQKFKKKN